MEHYYQNILPDWFTFAELYERMVREFPSGSHFVEIGSWIGRSAVFMGVEIINSGKNINFDCIDNWEFSDSIFSTDNYLNEAKSTAFAEFLNNILPISNTVNYFRLDSIQGSNLYKDESLDFIFIDASHEYKNVKKDLIHWYPKVKFGGVIAGHDYTYPDVNQAVNEFFKNKIIETPDISWFHRKI